MAIPSDADDSERAVPDGRDIERDLKQVMLSGLVVTVPLFVTILVLGWILNMVSGALTPLAGALGVLEPLSNASPLLLDFVAGGVVLGVIFAAGLVSQHGPATSVGQRLDVLVKDVPGVGSIYSSVEQVSETLIGSDAEAFREVKLVEFPTEGTYALAFLTAETPSEIEDAAGRTDMLTVFVPMAPNPVMGGHLLSVSQDRVYDVDLSVEAAMQAIVTTGVTVDEDAGKAAGE